MNSSRARNPARTLERFVNLARLFDFRTTALSFLSIVAATILLVSAPDSLRLPGEYTYLGPVNWDSRVEQSESTLYLTGERQTQNDLVVQGSIATLGTLSKPTVIVNFASRESGLQLMVSPSLKKVGNELYLVVRDDLPVDIDGSCPECGIPTRQVFIGDLSDETRMHDFVINIRNVPPYSYLQFNDEVGELPLEISPENVDLSVSQLRLGNMEIVDRSEVVSVKNFQVSYSVDQKGLVAGNIAALALMFGVVMAIISYSKFATKAHRQTSRQSK